MAQFDPESVEDTAPQDFNILVREALSHLYDTAYLQGHKLAALFAGLKTTDPKVRAQVLREAVIHAISDLKPLPHVSPHDPAFRSYAVLRHKYLEGLSNEEIQERLSISRRQFFREQNRACEALAALLWERRSTIEQRENSIEERPQTLGEELEQMGLQPKQFCLADTLNQAIAAVRGLADTRGVVLTTVGDRSAEVYADEAISRQAIVGILSALVQAFHGRYLELVITAEEHSTALVIRDLPEFTITLEEHMIFPQRLAERTGGRLSVGGGNHSVRLSLPTARKTHVLIVEDNPKTLRLFQRYLQPYRYRVTTTQDSRTAIAEIKQSLPDIVVLDVMMREVDGWQILQNLKTDPATRDIPVLVCSVLDESELALTIGADCYLRKPVNQSSLVMALAKLRPG